MQKTIPTTCFRRTVLRGLGASLLAAPFYGLLRPKSRARAAQACKRLIVWFSPNGTVHAHFRPQGSETSFSFAPGSILEPLAAHKANLIVFDGLDFVQARQTNHEGGMEHMLTGGGDISLDQYLARELGTGTPFSSIELGVQTSAWGAGIQTRMSYDEAHRYVHPEDDPVAAYARLFGGVGRGPAEVDATWKRKKSVIDLVRSELRELEGELGGEERPKLQSHLESLRTLERRLSGAGVPEGCAGMPAPTLLDGKSNDRFPEIGELQTDLLVAAAACDASRVLSLQWSHTVSPTIFSWEKLGEGHHELSHKDDGNAAGVAAFVTAERWFAGQFARLLDKLASTEEADGSGSLLDTSLVLWVKELGDGRLHDFSSVPMVLAGRGNGTVAPGRYLKYAGEPHQKLLVSICHAMGVPREHFGVESIRGPLSGVLA